MVKSKDIDEYISRFPKDVQKTLEQIRATIKTTAVGTEESISYDMPTFNLNGTYLIYFAAFKNHIGLYSVPTGHPDFNEEFANYKTGKGSIQFPLNQPIPFDLIERIVKFRVKENTERAKMKK